MSFLVGGVREERFKTPLSADASSSARSPGTAGTYSSTLKRSNQAEALDHAFTSLVFEIQHRLELVAHVHRVRLERWLRKLHEPEHNATWKRNRNNHARLMLACLKMGRLEPPFDTHPKEGRLDTLPPHALFAIKTSSEARRLERAAGPTGDWVTDPGVPGARLRTAGGGTAGGGTAGGTAGSPGLGFESSKYTAARGGAPIPGLSLGRNAKTLEEMLRRSSDDVEGDGEGGAAGGGRSSPSRRVKDVLEIKGDMRDWLGKGAKGELAQKELGAQKERAKELELRLESTELRLKTATDELQRLRDGMVRQQKRHAEEMAELQRAHQREMSMFAKLVESKWDEREDETLRAVGVGGVGGVGGTRAGGVADGRVIKSATGGASVVPAIQVAGDFTFSREPSVLVPAEVAGAGDAAAEFFGYLERFRADTERIRAHVGAG